MNSALEYMVNLHPSLTNDYKTPDGKSSESCGLIAINIAKKLLDEGKRPYIASIQGKLEDGLNSELIIPKSFEGRVSWDAHYVCCEGGLVYDPMVDTKPMALSDYCSIAFGDGVEMGIFVAKDEIKEFIGTIFPFSQI